MKQILFEQGKLYYVELPDIKPEICKSPCKNLEWCTCIRPAHQYDQDFKRALANKVEVKNSEVLGIQKATKILGDCEHRFERNCDCEVVEDNSYILFNGFEKHDGDTFPLPDGIEVEIKKDGNLFSCLNRDIAILKRIEPEKSIARRLYDETPQEVKDKVRAYGNQIVNKSVEPEKKHKRVFDGMTHEEIFEWLDKRCMFSDHQKDYVHMVLIKLCSK